MNESFLFLHFNLIWWGGGLDYLFGCVEILTSNLSDSWLKFLHFGRL